MCRFHLMGHPLQFWGTRLGQNLCYDVLHIVVCRWLLDTELSHSDSRPMKLSSKSPNASEVNGAANKSKNLRIEVNHLIHYMYNSLLNNPNQSESIPLRTRGLFQLQWLKSVLKHKFEQKVKNVSINRKQPLTRMLFLCLLKLSKNQSVVCFSDYCYVL